jgi:putative transposase
MKLTRAKVRFILRQSGKGVATREIARDMKGSQRRVQQVIKEYNDTGREPVYGERIGRPSKPYDKREAQIVKAVYERYRFGARVLEHVIRKQYMVCISHNHIHMYMKAQGLALSLRMIV